VAAELIVRIGIRPFPRRRAYLARRRRPAVIGPRASSLTLLAGLASRRLAAQWLTK
jgi:hypothetical protein